jgi:hypothetical protein
MSSGILQRQELLYQLKLLHYKVILEPPPEYLKYPKILKYH